MSVTRFYARHRRAWTPRLWPLVLLSGASTFAANLLLQPTALEAVGLGFLIAVVIGVGRWEVWRHRHPVITHAEYITDYLRDMRETARWN